MRRVLMDGTAIGKASEVKPHPLDWGSQTRLTRRSGTPRETQVKQGDGVAFVKTRNESKTKGMTEAQRDLSLARSAMG